MENVKPSEVKIWSRLGSCGAFGMAMTRLAQRYENLAVITADLCFYSGLERFKASNPDKFYNVGIAEQNMVGVAAGMASEGMNVFATTYATFASMRACDQVKVNMGYMRLPVKLVGMTGGLTTGILGATHTSIEDLAIMRAIPNIVILSPSDALSVVGLTEAAAKYDGPVYIRLTGTMPSPIIYDKDTEFEIGKAKVLADGDDVSIVATGATVATAVNVANALKYEGVECRVPYN
ncbi:MAG: transketolase C-terminal domain-containing protein [Candidatus Cloacimonetes bacterium]|nr:transketolase C-terminal domain-containing protein [Candidatus Cloacimonadota bacterium]